MNHILCPVRNGLHLTREAVRTFLAQDIGDVEVLIVDNDSQDGTAQWLWSQPVNTVHFRPGKSVAASWNFGLRHLFGQGAEYVLVVNNDVELRPDTYRHLVADGGLFVTAVGTRDRSKIEPRKTVIYPDDDMLSPKTIEVYDPPNPEKRRNHPDYSNYLIRREAWEKAGPFNEDCIGSYTEDSWHHKALYDAGITAYCLELPFLHYGAQTLANADQVEAAAIRANADRNREMFRKHFGYEVGSPEYYRAFQSSPPPSEEAGELPQS